MSTLFECVLNLIDIEDIKDFVLDRIDSSRVLPDEDDEDECELFWDSIHNDDLDFWQGFSEGYCRREYDAGEIFIMLNWLATEGEVFSKHDWTKIDPPFVVNYTADFLIRSYKQDEFKEWVREKLKDNTEEDEDDEDTEDEDNEDDDTEDDDTEDDDTEDIMFTDEMIEESLSKMSNPAPSA